MEVPLNDDNDGGVVDIDPAAVEHAAAPMNNAHMEAEDVPVHAPDEAAASSNDAAAAFAAASASGMPPSPSSSPSAAAAASFSSSSGGGAPASLTSFASMRSSGGRVVLGPAPRSAEVDVTDPEKKAGNLGSTDVRLQALAYTTYRVSSKLVFAPEPGMSDERLVQSSVLRRYSDFVFLHDALTADLPEVLVADLPPPGIMNRFDAQYIEARRRGLHLFLQRCLAHEVLSRHPLLHVFLSATDAELAQAKLAQEAAHKASAGEKVKGWLSAASSFMSDALGKPSLHSLTAEDLECRKMVRYVHELQKEFTRLIEQMESLLPQQDKLGKAFGALGVAADSLAQAEGDKSAAAAAGAGSPRAAAAAVEGSGSVEYSPPNQSSLSPSSASAAAASMGLVGDAELARLLHLLSQTAEQIRQRAHAKSEAEEVDVLEPLKDACRQAHAVELLLGRREACMREYHALLNAQSSARTKLEASKNPAAAAERQQSLDSCGFAVESKERELRDMTVAVRREFERSQAEKTAAVSFIVRAFIKMQIKHSEENARTWTNMLTQIEDANVGADA